MHKNTGLLTGIAGFSQSPDIIIHVFHVINIVNLRHRVNPGGRVDENSGVYYITDMVHIHDGKITNLDIDLRTASKVVGDVNTCLRRIVLRFTVPNPDFYCEPDMWTNIGPTVYKNVYLELNDAIIAGGTRLDCTEISVYEATRLVKNLTTLIDLEKLT